MSPKKFFQDLIKNKDTKTMNPKMLVILIVGIALMLISNFYSDKNQTVETFATQKDQTKNSEQVSSDEPTDTEDKNSNLNKSDLEKSYEFELQQALEQMSGVSNVTVIVKLSSSERNVYEKNNSTLKKQTEETDKDNGKRNIEETSNENKVVVIKDGTKDIPLIIEKDMPEVNGVLVVAEGVERISIKAKVIEAVTRVFSVESHRVAVMEK
ncbi:MAG: Sporulation stage protein [Bacillales bacterium]|nr:Sporulation stage protein [Bacillales bacterium]